MRIGVYVGSWRLTRLGGMGVYLRELLAGARQLRDAGAEIVLLADRDNRDAARELDSRAPIVLMDRPSIDRIPAGERRRAVALRKLSYRCPALADARRGTVWSAAAAAYLWGLDDATIAAGIDLLYFAIPPYVKRPRVPYVLTLHDLKHLHRPQDHSRSDLARRRRWGRVARAADSVISSYDHVRRDVLRHFHVAPERACVIAPAVPVDRRRRVGDGAIPSRVQLPPRFGLLPAQFWVHKNHALVLLALHHLRRDRGIDIPIVCTGQTRGECAEHFARMRDLARQLSVDDLFIALGHVQPHTLGALYDAATFVLVPTLYDPGSFPAMEALAIGKPLIASNVTSLPELVGDAGVLFDPHSVDELVEAMARIWIDEELRRELSRRGPGRIAKRDWTDVARDWLAICQRAARNFHRETAPHDTPFGVCGSTDPVTGAVFASR